MPPLAMLPPDTDLETKAVLRQAAIAHRHLAELKGRATAIPNSTILITTLALQEAMDSSAVESIVTTHDELYKAEIFDHLAAISPATKEVRMYARALRQAYTRLRKTGLIRLDDIKAIQRTLEPNKPGVRKIPGTNLTDLATGHVIYTPPQSEKDILPLLDNLIAFSQDPQMPVASHLDPLVKMAVFHYQFESIHPFYGVMVKSCGWS